MPAAWNSIHVSHLARIQELGHLPLPPRMCISGKLRSKAELVLKPGHSYKRCRHPKECFHGQIPIHSSPRPILKSPFETPTTYSRSWRASAVIKNKMKRHHPSTLSQISLWSSLKEAGLSCWPLHFISSTKKVWAEVCAECPGSQACRWKTESCVSKLFR